jgi:hypothetical protein
MEIEIQSFVLNAEYIIEVPISLKTNAIIGIGRIA